MDLKQFELFQSAVQWVVDEKRASERRTKHHPIRHKQRFWGEGKILGKVLVVKKAPWPLLGTSAVVMVCPSSACLAGNIVLTHGDKMVTADAHTPNSTVTVDYCVDDKGEMHLIGSRASELTGLDDGQAAELFAPDLSRPSVIELATKIARSHGYELELV